MEINNRTVRLLYQTNNYFDENLWSFLEENYDLKLDTNEFLIKNKFIFLDKNILNALKNKELDEGDLIQAQTLGEVLESKNKNYNVGEYVLGIGFVQDYYISKGIKCKKFEISEFNYSNDKVVIGIENFSIAFTNLIDLNDEKKIILKP